MNLPEFKAWFEGFTEDMSGAPSAKQWKRICDRIKTIKDEPTTKHIFHDYYERPWRRYYEKVVPSWEPIWMSADSSQRLSNDTRQAADFDAGKAFNYLGRAESLSMKG